MEEAIIKSNNNLQLHHQISRHDTDDDTGIGSGKDGGGGGSEGGGGAKSSSAAGESGDRSGQLNLSGSIGGGAGSGRRSGSGGDPDPEEDEDYELDVEDREEGEGDSAEQRAERRGESIASRRRSSSDPVNLSIVKTQDVDSDDANIDVETIGHTPAKVGSFRCERND